MIEFKTQQFLPRCSLLDDERSSQIRPSPSESDASMSRNGSNKPRPLTEERILSLETSIVGRPASCCSCWPVSMSQSHSNPHSFTIGAHKAVDSVTVEFSVISETSYESWINLIRCFLGLQVGTDVGFCDSSRFDLKRCISHDAS